jgi:methylamine dehydrogenase light chain
VIVTRWLDRFMERGARDLAKRTSRRSFLTRLGTVLVGGASLPLSRRAPAKAIPPGSVPDDAKLTGDSAIRRAAPTGATARSTASSARAAAAPRRVSAGHGISPITWIGTTLPPRQQNYVISYNDCCGASLCMRAHRTERPVYYVEEQRSPLVLRHEEPCGASVTIVSGRRRVVRRSVALGLLAAGGTPAPMRRTSVRAQLPGLPSRGRCQTPGSVPPLVGSVARFLDAGRARVSRRCPASRRRPRRRDARRGHNWMLEKFDHAHVPGFVPYDAAEIGRLREAAHRRRNVAEAAARDDRRHAVGARRARRRCLYATDAGGSLSCLR